MIVLWNLPEAIYNEPIKLVVIVIPNMPQNTLFEPRHTKICVHNLQQVHCLIGLRSREDLAV